MFDSTDRDLEKWVGETLKGVSVTFGPPREGKERSEINLCLFEVIPVPAPRGVKRPPLQAAARYVVSSWAPDPKEAHAILGKLLFAAMDRPDIEVEAEPVPATLWTAFGSTPRPSFVLRALVRRERPEKRPPLVRAPLVLKDGSVRSLQGKVVGPGLVPLMGARVEVPALDLVALTDSQGKFVFAAVPPYPKIEVRVQCKGREYSVVADGASGREPLVIELKGLEEA